MRGLPLNLLSALLTAALVFAPLTANAALEYDRSVVDTPRRVYATDPDDAWSRSGMIQFDEFITQIARADVVFLGEYHDDPATHRLQLDIFKALYYARQGRISLGMEQFERDVQPVIGTYLANGLTEDEFLAESRPWPNYDRDYRPLVEYCREMCLPVVATNCPRPLASKIAKEGYEVAWDSYTADERMWLCRETTHPRDAYWQLFSGLMGGGGHGMGIDEEVVANYYAAQCLKDDTMAESISLQLESIPYRLVVHTNGSFHSDYGLGTVSRVKTRLPLSRVVTVAIRPVDSWNGIDLTAEDFLPEALPDAAVEGYGQPLRVADYIIYVQSPDWGSADPVPARPVVEDPHAGMEMPAMPPAKDPEAEEPPAGMPGMGDDGNEDEPETDAKSGATPK